MATLFAPSPLPQGRGGRGGGTIGKISSITVKCGATYKLIGYIFWIQASWFLCGETARMHLKAFEGLSPPTPIEIMVFLVLGWLFVLIGEYKAMGLKKIDR